MKASQQLELSFLVKSAGKLERLFRSGQMGLAEFERGMRGHPTPAGFNSARGGSDSALWNVVARDVRGFEPRDPSALRNRRLAGGPRISAFKEFPATHRSNTPGPSLADLHFQLAKGGKGQATPGYPEWLKAQLREAAIKEQRTSRMVRDKMQTTPSLSTRFQDYRNGGVTPEIRKRNALFARQQNPVQPLPLL